MTDKQLMALLRHHVNYKIIEFHFGGDKLLKVTYFDHGGNYHCESTTHDGKLITHPV